MTRPSSVVAAGGTVQVLMPSKRGRYPLRRMLDTVSAHGGAELRITVGARTAVVARISAPAAAGDPVAGPVSPARLALSVSAVR